MFRNTIFSLYPADINESDLISLTITIGEDHVLMVRTGIYLRSCCSRTEIAPDFISSARGFNKSRIGLITVLYLGRYGLHKQP